MRLTDLREGAVLFEATKPIWQENINRYAQASRDFNPIHIDEEFARKTPLGGTIAHGMLILAYLSEQMVAAFGRDWLTAGKLDVRFKAPARPGDAVTVTGTVRRTENIEGRTLVRCDVLCRNQAGETVITGDAWVKISGGEAF